MTMTVQDTQRYTQGKRRQEKAGEKRRQEERRRYGIHAIRHVHFEGAGLAKAVSYSSNALKQDTLGQDRRGQILAPTVKITSPKERTKMCLGVSGSPRPPGHPSPCGPWPNKTLQ